MLLIFSHYAFDMHFFMHFICALATCLLCIWNTLSLCCWLVDCCGLRLRGERKRNIVVGHLVTNLLLWICYNLATWSIHLLRAPYDLSMISLQSLYDVNTFSLQYCYVLYTICDLAMCRIFVIATWHVTALTTLLVSHYWLIVVEWCWEWEWQKMGCTYGMIFMSLLHSSYALYISSLRSPYALTMLLLRSCYVLRSRYAQYYGLLSLHLQYTRYTLLLCTFYTLISQECHC